MLALLPKPASETSSPRYIMPELHPYQKLWLMPKPQRYAYLYGAGPNMLASYDFDLLPPIKNGENLTFTWKVIAS